MAALIIRTTTTQCLPKPCIKVGLWSFRTRERHEPMEQVITATECHACQMAGVESRSWPVGEKKGMEWVALMRQCSSISVSFLFSAICKIAESLPKTRNLPDFPCLLTKVNNQVIPPIQVIAVSVDPKETTEVSTKMQSPGVNKEMADQGPSIVGEVQSLALAITTAAETSTPTSQTTCRILSQGEVSSRASAPSSSSAAQGISMPVVENSAVGRTILQVLKSADEACKPIVAELEQLLTVLETPGFKVLQNLGMLIKIKSLLQQIFEIKPFMASSGQFLVQWLDSILDKAAMVQKMPDHSHDPAVVVNQYRAYKARQIDLYGKAEASLKELEAIEQEKQRVRAQIEADRLHRAKLILELQELERQTSASEPVIDALTSQAIALTLAETEANSLQKSINLEFENALKLSDDLRLNEIDCVRLLIAANQEWGLMGREPVEVLHLAAGLWYTERRDLLTALYTLLRAIVLDQGLEADLVSDIQKYLENLINNGLRHRLISLIKELNREEPAGLGGPHYEHYVLDSRGALVERRAVVSRERLILGHCLVLSILVVRNEFKGCKGYTFRFKRLCH
ncbi:nuclear pore complex protein NUP205 [Prunus yedoensis var. nudiflora]|uniref:Nuclear pore complex protein NUP205 n=1 Tax=Prunus yedoensis var. nudiflora TaxID=2094558 RepID=A0A314UTL4_PRUYE|nr:nuclear pore complex protein NUP205 [Prunus yedoensis var. nudiflora]